MTGALVINSSNDNQIRSVKEIKLVNYGQPYARV